MYQISKTDTKTYERTPSHIISTYECSAYKLSLWNATHSYVKSLLYRTGDSECLAFLQCRCVVQNFLGLILKITGALGEL